MTAAELIGYLADNFGDGEEVTLSDLETILSDANRFEGWF